MEKQGFDFEVYAPPKAQPRFSIKFLNLQTSKSQQRNRCAQYKLKKLFAMIKISLLTPMICFGINSILFGQDSLRCFPTNIKNETPNYAVFSSNGKYVATGVYGAIRVWETDSNIFKDYKAVAKNETPLFVSFSPDDKFIASGVYGAVRIWELNTDNYTDYKFNTVNSTPNFVCFSPNGEYIATGIFGAARVWNLKSGKFLDYPTRLKNETPQFVTFSSDSQFIAFGSFGEVRTWKITN